MTGAPIGHTFRVVLVGHNRASNPSVEPQEDDPESHDPLAADVTAILTWSKLGALVVVAFATAVTPANAVTTFAFTQTARDPTNQTSATFAWTGTGPFNCSLDGATFAACTSPKSSPASRRGDTSSSAGNELSTGAPPTITDDWTVDLTPPTTVVTSSHRRSRPPPRRRSRQLAGYHGDVPVLA